MKKQILILSLVLLPIIAMTQSNIQPDSALTFRFTQDGDSTLSISQIYYYNASNILEKEIRTEYNFVYHYIYNTDGRVTACYMIDESKDIDTTGKEYFIYSDSNILYNRQFPVIHDHWDPELEKDTFYVIYRDTDKGVFYGVHTYSYSKLLNSMLQAYTFNNINYYYSDSIIFESNFSISDTVFERDKSFYFSYNEEEKLTHVLLSATYGDYEFELFYNQDDECYKVEVYELSFIEDSIVKAKADCIVRSFDNAGKIMEDYLIEYLPINRNHRTIYNYSEEGVILSEIKYSVVDSLDTGYPVMKKYYYYKSETGVNEISANSFSIFPNPVQSQFTITNTENTTICLYNILGQKVKQITGTAENTIIQTEDLSAGIYVVKVEKEGIVFTKKVQVIR